jgi:hypothetical protein
MDGWNERTRASQRRPATKAQHEEKKKQFSVYRRRVKSGHRFGKYGGTYNAGKLFF